MQVLNLDALPGKMAIVGGGYIALEFAGIYNNFGTEVHVLWRQAREPFLLPIASLRPRCAKMLKLSTHTCQCQNSWTSPHDHPCPWWPQPEPAMSIRVLGKSP